VGLTIGDDVTLWDINETKGRGPFEELVTDYDIVVNCIYLAPNPENPVKPFITDQLLDTLPRRLSVIVDVSCDISNPQNPLPVYRTGTTFLEPTIRIRQGTDLATSSFDAQLQKVRLISTYSPCVGRTLIFILRLLLLWT
jgi:hypothetical protein